jgi:hypothetical protein
MDHQWGLEMVDEMAAEKFMAWELNPNTANTVQAKWGRKR